MEGSEADVDVEVDDDGAQQIEAQLSGGDRQSQLAAGSSASARGKRTLIGFAQRSILEEFYRSGMNSASMQFQHMHQAACDKTGLDLNVVKNWIRNRRRPTNPNEAHVPMHREQQQQPQQLSQQHPATPPHSVALLGTPLAFTRGPPEGKRIRLDPLPMPSLMAQSAVAQTSLSPNNGGSPMLVKLRVADSGECDFVEVEVEHLSFQGLLKACCEELEVQPSDVLKIRKLPNIWVRKDRDIQRMRDGQELEVVLSSHVQPLTSVLTVNPFPSSSGLSLMTVSCEPTVGGRSDMEHGNGASLSMADMPCHSSSSQQSH